MSEREYGKKFVEEMELEPFLDEYEHVTGVAIAVVERSERPDFICQCRGREIGLELVKAMQNPILRRWEGHSRT